MSRMKVKLTMDIKDCGIRKCFYGVIFEGVRESCIGISKDIMKIDWSENYKEMKGVRNLREASSKLMDIAYRGYKSKNCKIVIN